MFSITKNQRLGEAQTPLSFVATRQFYPSFYPRKKRVFVTISALLIHKSVIVGLY